MRGYRSMLYVPLKSSGTSIGAIVVTRATTGTFAPHLVDLLQTFADQAVIAIENVRLFNETKEALEPSNGHRRYPQGDRQSSPDERSAGVRGHRRAFEDADRCPRDHGGPLHR